MPLRTTTYSLLATVPVLALALGSSLVAPPRVGAFAHTEASSDTDASRPEFYTTKVQPIFQANCYRCHAGLNHRGGLVMNTQAALMKGGHDGVVLVPGHPEQSLLVKLIRHEGPKNDPMPMPPKSKISDGDVAIVEAWVRAGAAMPPDPPASR